MLENDIVLPDNAKFHYSAPAIRLIGEAGAGVLHIPAYSPEFNPIEERISKIKEFLRTAKARTKRKLRNTLRKAIEKSPSGIFADGSRIMAIHSHSSENRCNAPIMRDGILSAVGNTPLIRLSRILKSISFQLYAKLEYLNPGGSMKDRPALCILEHAMEAGFLKPGCMVVESSSGNMGIGLAQACSSLGLEFICVVDPKTTQQNIRLLKIYGARVDMVTEPDGGTGEYLQARLNRVQSLLLSIKNSFWPNQYANLNNPLAHHQTMREIAQALDGKVDYLFCAASTCGTLRGCAEYVRKHGLNTKIHAVDAVGSVIFGGPKGKRMIPGHGASLRPALYEDGLADKCIHVTDMDCVSGCRRLVAEEAILAGGSSGAVIAAIDCVKETIPPGSNCALIFPDRGERYLDTVYSDEWVRTHIGETAPRKENLT